MWHTVISMKMAVIINSNTEKLHACLILVVSETSVICGRRKLLLVENLNMNNCCLKKYHVAVVLTFC